jgi:DNA modification methylase
MQIEHLPIEKIRDYANNPKAHPADQVKKIAAAIAEFRWDQPIVVDGDLVIIKGHGRFLAAKELGLKTVPVVIADYLTPAQVRAARLADNKVAESEWFPESLALELKALQEMDFDLGLTGFDLPELEALGIGEPGAPPPEDPGPQVDRAAELQEKWGTALGQIWEVGRHRVLCGDCRRGERLFAGKKFDLLVTDPPYGVSYAAKNEFLNAIAKGNRIQEPIAGDHQTPEQMSAFWKEAFLAARAHAKPGANYYVTGPQGGDLLLLLLLALKDSGFPLHHMLIWAKNNHVLGRSDYNYKHEPILYGWVEGAGHKFYGGGGETSLWEVDKPLKSELHPVMKPVELFARAIRNSSLIDEIVYDPFLGSGTTLVAAEQLGRICCGTEIAPGYMGVILERASGLGLEPRLLEAMEGTE